MEERRLEMKQLKEDVSVLKKDQEEIKVEVKKITELLQAWESAKGFVKVIEVISKLVKLLAPIVLVIIAGYYLLTTGHLPKQ